MLNLYYWLMTQSSKAFSYCHNLLIHMALVAINYNKCYNLIYYVEYLKTIELFFRSPNRLKNAVNYQFQIVLIIYRVVIVKVRWQIRSFTALTPLAALLLLRWEFIKENKKTRTWQRKWSRKKERFFFFLGRFLGRVLVLFLAFLFSCFLTFLFFL